MSNSEPKEPEESKQENKEDSQWKTLLQNLSPLIVKHKKKLIIAGSALVGCLLLILLFTSGQTDPEELVHQFEMAVVTGDIDKVKDLVEPDDGLELEEKYLQQFVDHAQTEPEYHDTLMWLLNAQAAHYAQSEAVLQYGTDAMTTAELKKAGDYYVKENKRTLLPDTYSIGIRPYYITLETNKPKAKLKVDDEHVFETTKKKQEYRYGPVMPGIYLTQASRKYEYADLSTKDKVTLFGHHSRRVPADLNLHEEAVKIDSSFGHVTLFVNGKKVGKVKDHETFGPLTKDGSIKIHGEANFSWGKAKSSPSAVEEETDTVDVTPDPFSSDKAEKQAIQVVNQYVKERVAAYKKLDASLFTVLDDNAKKSETEAIKSMKEYEKTYLGKALGTRIDFSYTEFNKNDETDRYEVKVPVEFHVKEVTRGKYFGSDDPMEEEFKEMTLTLTYQEKQKKWLVSEVKDRYTTIDYWSDDNIMKGKRVKKSTFN